MKGIIFDFNGTLYWDSQLHYDAWREYSKILRGYEFTTQEMQEKMFGHTNEDIIEYAIGKKPTKELVEKYGREKEERLAGAKDDARGKYVSILDDFKNRKSDVIREAQNSAQDELNKAQGELDNLSNEVKEGLKGRMNELAGDIAEKILGYRSDINGFDDDTVNRVLYH